MAVLFGLGAVSVAIEAAALGLGPATLSSGLGEPLRMSIPVTLQPDEEIGCVQVRPHGDDLPSVFNTRSQILRSGGRTVVQIQSAAAVDEPAVGIVVSVGCASPVARDYVLFLDPPSVAPVASADAPAPAVVAPAPRATRPPRADAAQATVPATRGRAVDAPRPARRRAPVVRSADAASGSSKAPAAAGARTRATGSGDRLSVVPTEPPVIGRTARSPQPGVFPPPVTDPAAVDAARAAATAQERAGAPAAGPATPAAAAPAETAAVTAPTSSTADADAAAREEALRQQQIALQTQIKNLSDQIAALRVQATSLAVRNEALEGTAFSPALVWLLIALAVIAIAVAGWMAWRYAQLRRSLEGSAWWAGQTVQDVVDGPVDGASPAAPGTVVSAAPPPAPRAPARGQAGQPAPADVRPSTPQTTTATSSAQRSHIDRIRPAVRAPGSVYPAAMDTDFTVSDIEAAMATVRTVSPPRADKPVDPLAESDFTGLGGPTITSPFDEIAPAPAVAKPGDEPAHFVDLDIPPMPPQAAAARPNPAEPPPAPAPLADLPFTLDFPGGFDPLATDSMKTTIVDRHVADEPSTGAGAPNDLDFELPSPTQILAMTTFDPGGDAPPPVRHAATALNDLFGSDDDRGRTTEPEPEPDDRDGSPLTGSEVDRLTSPLGPFTDANGLTERGRLARFADLLTRVDDLSIADPLAAIAELRQHVLRDERIPTLLWLRLFDLYRIVDKRPVYEALAEHFARRYHRPMVGWTEALADRTPQRPLSALAAIDREVEAQWGTEAGVRYLDTLLCDRTQDDAIVFNAVLQADLLDAAKVFPEPRTS